MSATASHQSVFYSHTSGIKDTILRSKPLDKAGSVLSFALFIIGILSLTGHLSGVVAGSCGIGLSLPLVLINLKSAAKKAEGVFKVKKVLIIQALALAVVTLLSALVVAGLLPKMCIGIGVFSIIGLTLLLSCISVCVPSIAYGMRLGHAVAQNDAEGTQNILTEFKTEIRILSS